MSGEALVQILITGGIGALALAFVQIYKAVRSGTSMSNKRITATLEQMRAEARNEARQATSDALYFQYVAARYAAQLARAGVTPIPDFTSLVPPSQRNGMDHEKRTERRRPTIERRWHREGEGRDRA